MMFILFGLEHLTFGYHTGSFEAAVKRACDVHQILALLIAGAFGGVAWYLLKRVSTAAINASTQPRIGGLLRLWSKRVATWRPHPTSASQVPASSNLAPAMIACEAREVRGDARR
ncbi:MAG: hypothetical protein ACR2ND_09955 [Solirubrobacteraceae bacterium]